MVILRSYPLSLILRWTLKFIIIFLIWSSVPVVLHEFLHFDFILVPWLPIALIGTALAFYLGFKNNASYERMWEARKIWGSIVNNSRTFTSMINTYLHFTETEIRQTMVKRHIAWLTALRYSLRGRRPWEHNNLRDNPNYLKNSVIDEFDDALEEKLRAYLSEEELKYVMSRKTPATHILHFQMKEMDHLHQKGTLDVLYHVEMGNMIKNLYDDQGKSERIKNFPFPRQYASLNFYYVWLFIILLPFGMLGEFEKFGENMIWLNIPFSTIVSWVFYTMEMVGDYSENPFEGSYNDVPITDISNKIETDILEMVDLTPSVKAVSHEKNVLF